MPGVALRAGLSMFSVGSLPSTGPPSPSPADSQSPCRQACPGLWTLIPVGHCHHRPGSGTGEFLSPPAQETAGAWLAPGEVASHQECAAYFLTPTFLSPLAVLGLDPSDLFSGGATLGPSWPLSFVLRIEDSGEKILLPQPIHSPRCTNCVPPEFMC